MLPYTTLTLLLVFGMSLASAAIINAAPSPLIARSPGRAGVGYTDRVVSIITVLISSSHLPLSFASRTSLND